MVKTPEMAQTMRDMLTLPVERRTPLGETKIPLPMMQPMMTPQPFSKLISALSLTPLLVEPWERDVRPIVEYNLD